MHFPVGPLALQNCRTRLARTLPLSFVRRTVQRQRPLVVPLNLIPLIGVLLVVTLYLLPQFQASGELLCTCNRPPLPQARHVAPLEQGPTVEISLDSVSLNGETKAETRRLEEDTIGGLIQPLYGDLLVHKNNFRLLHPAPQAFTGIVNIQADKHVRYGVIRRVLHTCAAAGYDTPHFVVETIPQYWFLP